MMRVFWLMFVLSLTSLMPSLVTAQAPPQRTPLQPRPRYALRAGDAVTLDYRYTPEFNQTVTLQPDGFVDLALIGSLHAAGLTLDQLHDLVVDRARTRLKDPELTLSLKEFERPYFAVAGEVEHPGRMDFTRRRLRSRPSCSPAASRAPPSNRTCTCSARSTAT